jgi:hypothetical protein
VRAFVEAGRLAPDVEQPVLFLGRIWEHAGEQEAAVLERFRDYAQRHPRSALGHYLVGKATGNEAALRRSLALQATPDASYELGQLLEKQGQNAAAALEFERCAWRQSVRHPISACSGSTRAWGKPQRRRRTVRSTPS